MKKTLFALCLSASMALAAGPKPAAKPTAPPTGGAAAPVEPPKPLTADEKQKALYALGVMVAQRTPMGQSGFNAEDLAEVVAGFSDNSQKKDLKFKPEEWSPKIDQVLQEQSKIRAAKSKEEGAGFLAKAEKEAGAQKLPSGLIYFETQAGTGALPTAADTVKVHYKGTLIDGKEFDSSYKRGTPAEFPLGGVIKCWTEGVAKMKVGGKARLVCPSDIAYGDRGAGGDIPPGAVLNFEVELLEIKGK
jgi:FKBP-type peptidyl-prolyl cis-trans isomerase FkpA